MAVRAETGGQFTDFPDDSGDFCLIGIGRINLDQGPVICTDENKTEIIIERDMPIAEVFARGGVFFLDHIDGPTSQPGCSITLVNSDEYIDLGVTRKLDKRQVMVKLRISHREILPTVTIE